MAKYKNIQELADAFRSGLLKGWTLMVDNDSSYLSWVGARPPDMTDDEREEFFDTKGEEADKLWDSPDVYILDQALLAAGIPNEGV